MNFELNILGCGSAVPMEGRNHSAQLLKYKNRHFLIDCGEGTQQQFQRFSLGWGKIVAILISHLHGDHFLGLVGLLSTMSMLGLKKPIKIYAPFGLRDIILSQLKNSGTVIQFPLTFIDLNNNIPEQIYEDPELTISTVPLNHGIYCNGFHFKEKPHLRSVIAANIPVGANLKKEDYKNLREGKDIIRNGKLYLKSDDLTEKPKSSSSYAYLSDTAFHSAVAEVITGVDYLYHESSFLENQAGKAVATQHSTAKQAAEIAKLAKAKHLILGHYSARYKNISPFKSEAEEVFKNVHLSSDGAKYIF